MPPSQRLPSRSPACAVGFLSRYGSREALACQQQSLAIRRELGELSNQDESLRDLGITMVAIGRAAEARQHWLEALGIFERLRSSKADDISALLRTADQQSGYLGLAGAAERAT